MDSAEKISIIKALDSNKDRAFFLQKGLTSFPSFSPSNGGLGEWDKAVWLENQLRQWGITDIEHVDSPDSRVESGKRPNFIVRISGKNPRTLWVLTHLDVVPPGDMDLWKTDPWTLSVDPDDNDIIHGRGVEDNQQPMVSSILLAVALIEQKIIPPMGLGLIFVSDEETGNSHGVDYLLKHKKNLFSSDDYIMVPDFGTEEGTLIEVAEKGVLWIKVSIIGIQCHASTPEAGKNSLVAAADMIVQVKDVEASFDEKDNLFSPNYSTMIPTRHDSNVPNINTMPGKDVFFIDCRVLPCYTIDEVFRAFQNLGQKIAQKYAMQVEVEINNVEPIFPPTDPQAPVVKALSKAIKAVYNIDAYPGGVGGSTVAGRIRELGLPAAVWARFLPNFHQPNEGSRLSCTVNDAKVFAHMLFNE